MKLLPVGLRLAQTDRIGRSPSVSKFTTSSESASDSLVTSTDCQAIRMSERSEMQCQNAYVRAEVPGLLFRDKASQPCYTLMKQLMGKR